MELQQSQKIDWNNNQKLFIQTLQIRIIEHYQCVVLMLERGMMPQIKVQLRAMLEGLFTLVALEKKSELVKSYIDQHKEGTKRNLKAALQFKDKGLSVAVKKLKIEKRYLAQKKHLQGEELNILTPKQWAKKAELEDFYNLYYASYSNSVHSNLSALDDHIDESETGPNLIFGPSESNLYEAFRCSVSILINMMSATSRSNNQDIYKELDCFKKKLNTLDTKYLEKK